MQKRYVYPAVLAKEGDGGYSAYCPDLPGCASGGRDVADAIDAIRDALGGWLYSALKHGDDIPPPNFDAPPGAGERITLIDLDMNAYLRSHNAAAVKKTLTIPGWLNEMAEAEEVNFSRVLKDALVHELGLDADAV